MKVLSDNICIWENALSDQWCKEVCEIVDNKIAIAEEKREGIPDEEVMGVAFRDNNKRIDVSMLMPTFGSLHQYEHELLVCLENCLSEMRDYYASISEMGSPLITRCEPMVTKIQRTPPGGGFSQWHFEQGPGENCPRRWGVWMLYLNTVDKGGKTDFPNQGLSLKPEAGTMVIWPATYTHPHRSAPDLEEWKYIITGWTVYPDSEEPVYEKSRIKS